MNLKKIIKLNKRKLNKRFNERELEKLEAESKKKKFFWIKD